MKIKTSIFLPRKSQHPNTTTVWVDLNFIDSFCEHLKGKKVNFKRSKINLSEDGRSEGLKIAEGIGNEIVIEGTEDIGNLMLGWDMKTK